MKEQKFKKVVDNEYDIDLISEISFPLISVILGFLFGYFMSIDNDIGILITGYLLFFSSVFYLVAFCYWIGGRKVYWMKVK